jgi:hypothetical protein
MKGLFKFPPYLYQRSCIAIPDLKHPPQPVVRKTTDNHSTLSLSLYKIKTKFTIEYPITFKTQNTTDNREKREKLHSISSLADDFPHIRFMKKAINNKIS